MEMSGTPTYVTKNVYAQLKNELEFRLNITDKIKH